MRKGFPHNNNMRQRQKRELRKGYIFAKDAHIFLCNQSLTSENLCSLHFPGVSTMTLMIAASVAVLLQTTALAFAPSAVRSTSRGRTVAGKQHRAQSLAVCISRGVKKHTKHPRSQMRRSQYARERERDTHTRARAAKHFVLLLLAPRGGRASPACFQKVSVSSGPDQRKMESPCSITRGSLEKRRRRRRRKTEIQTCDSTSRKRKLPFV